MTNAELMLWQQLRRKQLNGVGFRRQYPIASYIVDFAAPSAGLVVECDGGGHCESKYDQARDAFLCSKGFKVLRFWNNEIEESLPAVIDCIRKALPPAFPAP